MLDACFVKLAEFRQLDPTDEVCRNGGSCHTVNNAFQCDCAPGFNGTTSRVQSPFIVLYS